MRGLVIREPWIGLILGGRKSWEMRSRPISLRGRIGLIRQGTGHVCAVADLVDCLPPIAPDQLAQTRDRHAIPPEQFGDVARNRWLVPWVLGNVQILNPSVPYRHPSGAVQTIVLAPEVVAAIDAQLGAPVSLPVATAPVVDTAVPSTPRRTQPAAVEPASGRDHVHIRLTDGAIRNHNLSVRQALHLIPDDAIGGGSRAFLAKGAITVVFDPGTAVETDVAGDKLLLRCRGEVGDFFTRAGAVDGDLVEFRRISPRGFRVRLIEDPV